MILVIIMKRPPRPLDEDPYFNSLTSSMKKIKIKEKENKEKAKDVGNYLSQVYQSPLLPNSTDQAIWEKFYSKYGLKNQNSLLKEIPSCDLSKLEENMSEEGKIAFFAGQILSFDFQLNGLVKCELTNKSGSIEVFFERMFFKYNKKLENTLIRIEYNIQPNDYSTDDNDEYRELIKKKRDKPKIPLKQGVVVKLTDVSVVYIGESARYMLVPYDQDVEVYDSC